jgi:hypothetical protein
MGEVAYFGLGESAGAYHGIGEREIGMDSSLSELIGRLREQQDAVKELVAGNPRWRLIDLLPAFQNAVGTKTLLYYQAGRFNHATTP